MSCGKDVAITIFHISAEVLTCLRVPSSYSGVQVRGAAAAAGGKKCEGRIAALVILSGPANSIGAMLEDTVTLEAAGLGDGGSLQAVISPWIQSGTYEAHPSCGYKDALSLSLTLYTLKVEDDRTFLLERRYSDADSDDDCDFSIMEKDAREACPCDISLRGHISSDYMFSFESKFAPPVDRLQVWLEEGDVCSERRLMARGVVREVMWADWGDGGWHDIVREFPLQLVADSSGETCHENDSKVWRLAEIAAARDAQLSRVKQEGIKRGAELADAVMTNGLQFISTSVIEPQGDTDFTMESLQSMHVDDSRCSSNSREVGKMVFSANQHQISVVAYIPETNADANLCVEWLESVLKPFDGVLISSSREICKGKILASTDKGIRPLIVRDSLIIEANDFLRKKGLFPVDDEEDDYLFGDDDFLL